ncbi:MAG: diacylglycerol kinase [Proteobacteria bacterium]|nr:diacylglycerol kinase [Pseudomonadota bacterium]
MHHSSPRAFLLVAAASIALLLAGCEGDAGSSSANPAVSGLSVAARLGEQIFRDTALSASGRQSCATCHVRDFAFASDPTAAGPDRGLPVAVGGPAMTRTGFRNTPSIMYLAFAPTFAVDADGTPNGGFFRDGRAGTLAEQAIAPFLSAIEMANSDSAAVAARLSARPYFGDFVALYGSDVLADADVTLGRIGEALAAYEREDPEFRPFSSKFDAWRNGRVALSERELRGLALFNNPAKGNCAACHPSASADGVTPALFTDFSYDNLGVPRNGAIPANAPYPPDGTPLNGDDGLRPYYDLGLCGPFRDDGGRDRGALCGQFKVPSLRNVALTAPYFHNGRFATLREVLAFYVRRDTAPAEWYPVADGAVVLKFDDLPARYGGRFTVLADAPGSDAGYAGNVNTAEIPYNRRLGETPALDADDIDDVVAFLCTLTDGFDASTPAPQSLPPQCADPPVPAAAARIVTP